MEAGENNIKLYYNTEREKLVMPEYGRNVLGMVEYLKTIEDKDKRTEQANAVIKVMETLNPQVHQEDNYQQKLWDHLFIMADYDLDVDAPYPMPRPEDRMTKPMPLEIPNKPVKARHYGRNIESMIELIATKPDGEEKNNMIESLAIYMRQQYLIWNKDSVDEETIFHDIEKLSDYRIKVPEDISLGKVDSDMNLSRPGLNLNYNNNNNRNRGNNRGRRNFRKK